MRGRDHREQVTDWMFCACVEQRRRMKQEFGLVSIIPQAHVIHTFFHDSFVNKTLIEKNV